MIEEYENWEDSIRHTFIQLADYMNEVANPLDYILKCSEQGLVPKLFTVQNAKDELKKLREEINNLKQKTSEWVGEVYRANEFAVEQTNAHIDSVNRLQKLKDSLAHPVAYAKINERGDLYDLRLQNNPYDNQDKVIPLYRIIRE